MHDQAHGGRVVGGLRAAPEVEAVRPRVAVRRCRGHAGRREARPAGRRRSRAGLAPAHTVPSLTCLQHRLRQALRAHCALDAERASLPPPAREAHPDDVARHLRRPLQGEDLGPRQPDADRGCGALPPGHRARSSDRRSVRADEAAVRRRRRAAQASASARQTLLGVRHRADPGLPHGSRGCRFGLAVSGAGAAGGERPGSRVRAAGGLDGLGRQLDARGESRAPELRVQVAPVRLDGARPGDGGARAPRVSRESPRLQAARGGRGWALRDLPRCRAALVHEAARLLEDARGRLRRQREEEVRPVRGLAEGLGKN